jgi:hypothetical protein
MATQGRKNGGAAREKHRARSCALKKQEEQELALPTTGFSTRSAVLYGTTHFGLFAVFSLGRLLSGAFNLYHFLFLWM